MSAWSLRCAAGVAVLSLLGDWRYRRLPRLEREPAIGPLPSLSVIVPARDEAVALPRLLPSLRPERYPGRIEVIVVDDGSTDGTAVTAEQLGAHVLRVSGPPPGWLGKPHACHRGAEAASGEWLLFTDADTLHAPDGPARAVAWVLAAGLDGLSLFPAQERGALGDRIVLAAAFAGYFAGRGGEGLLNGQYVLLRRGVYEASGGFAAVRGEPLEDLALGRHLHALGYRVPAARGDRVVRVRMYADVPSMWRGLTRLAALSLRWSGPGAALTALTTALAAAPVGVVLGAVVRGRGRTGALMAWLIVCAGVLPWSIRMRAGPLALLAPLGAAFVQAAACWGLLARAAGTPIRWRGRAV